MINYVINIYTWFEGCIDSSVLQYLVIKHSNLDNNDDMRY